MVDFFETIWVASDTSSIDLEDGEVEDVKSDSSIGLSVRALDNGSWGFASTTSTGSEEIDREAVVEKACRLAELSPGRPDFETAMVERSPTSTKMTVEIDPRSIDLSEKIDYLVDCHEQAMQGRVKSTKFSYTEAETEFHYQNSSGEEASYNIFRTGVSGKAIAKEGDILQTASERAFGAKGFEVLDENNYLERAGDMGRKADDLLDAETPPSGQYPVIMDPELAGVFIHEAVGHASEGDLVAMDNSILKNRLGDQVGSETVTVFDDPSLKGKFGYYPFDWEGVPSKPTTIIENGVLNAYLNSRESAPQTNTPVTPNFRSQSYSNNPLVRMSNTYLKPGDWSLEEMLTDLNEGIYLRGSRGGQVSSGEGTFQFNAEDGYIIKDGELDQHLRDVSLSGKTLNILDRIDALANDLQYYPGFCGKGGQGVPVTDGGPHTRVKELLVGGGSNED
ncbi:TldD/PmbA family protein [Methanonatronarchaeum sp. AMET-Sl]|uniref:TldD/PmbA family protein n=1 Tax=Methanonatronarchaeum sp. AMET-Sl TaxID=3037654 RepID=UPI00244DD51E|nr:TldD/PmbA family protein [Methanonatronarchaeum sp. AMET-Sl]WGI17573.1 TldD/PmbA family protein [Methanonatronarchaeum sp. AMET-Sl]